MSRRGWGKARRTWLELILVLLEGHSHELPAGPHAGLLKQTLENGLHVTLGYLQTPGDLFVGKPLEHKAQHSALPLVENRHRRLTCAAFLRGRLRGRARQPLVG